MDALSRRPVRPADVCRELLQALEASEGRRQRRKRDTTPDALGLALKRGLLEAVVAEHPTPDEFESSLLERTLRRGEGAPAGAIRAMAIDILFEWRVAHASPEFQAWLDRGAPSDDRV